MGKELTRPAAHRERSRQSAAHGGGAHWVAVLLGGTPGGPCAGIGIIGRLHVGGGEEELVDRPRVGEQSRRRCGRGSSWTR